MTQGQSRRIRVSRIVLVLAVLLTLGVIGWRILQDSGSAARKGVPTAQAPAIAGDPISGLEAQVQKDPKDGQAWSRLAVALFETGRFADAIPAFDSAIAINPGTGTLWSSRGEARVMASERDPMPAAAVADFRKAIAIDSGDPRARYFLAVRRDLDGDHEGAIADWLVLLADTPPGAVWETDLRRTIEQVGKINGIAVADRLAKVHQAAASPPAARQAVPGPTAEDLRRAAALRPAEQRAMAEGMVARLEERLHGEPQNTDGWVMLMRSHVTLGRPDKAARALDDAVRGNPGKADMLREQATRLGIR